MVSSWLRTPGFQGAEVLGCLGRNALGCWEVGCMSVGEFGCWSGALVCLYVWVCLIAGGAWLLGCLVAWVLG